MDTFDTKITRDWQISLERVLKKHYLEIDMWKEYTVEAASNRLDLGRIVRKMISNGWQPIGGVCIDIHEEDARFLQSMVRTREE